MGIDRVGPAHLLFQIATEDLDVPGFVHYLGGGVVLGVYPRHRGGNEAGADQGALLTVEELRKRPPLGLDDELVPLLVAPLGRRSLRVVLHDVETGDGLAELDGQLLPVHLDFPRQVGAGVPLGALRLLVELDQGRTAALVVPGKKDLVLLLDGVEDLVRVAALDHD